MKQPKPINLFIADDDKFFRIGLRSELSKFENLHIIGEASNGHDLLNILRTFHTDVLLLDLKMPKLSGVAVLDRIREEAIPVRTIVISGNDDESEVLRAFRAGAKGYFVKGLDIDVAEIYSAICMVMKGKFYFNLLSGMALLEERLKQKTESSDQQPPITFSDKELDILRYLAQEMTSQQIADRTHYTKRSLDNIRQELIHRAGVRTSIGLVLYAIRNGHIQVSELRHAETAIQ